jgi:ABC-type ATPase with predicted acetyltransferase domain
MAAKRKKTKKTEQPKLALWRCEHCGEEIEALHDALGVGCYCGHWMRRNGHAIVEPISK